MKAFFQFIPFICLVMLCSCRKDPSPFEIHNLNNNTISAFGHAGMGIAFKYPINSYESLEAALRIGADGTEMDVQLTRDSILVLYHDGKLEESTSMTGTINEMTWSQLENCRYASPIATDIKLQKADDVFTQFNNGTRIFTFDCKLHNRDGLDYDVFLHQYANALIAIINRHQLKDHAFIESQDAHFLEILKSIDPGLKLFTYPENFEKGLEIADKMNLYGITISNNDITADQLSIAHAHNRRVTLWDVRTEDEDIDAIKKSPDYIQSDKLIHLLQVFDGYKKQGWKNLQW